MLGVLACTECCLQLAMDTVNDLQKLTANISTASQDEDDEPLECEVCAQCCKSPLSLHCRMLMTCGRTYQADLMPHAHGRVNRSHGVCPRCTNWREHSLIVQVGSQNNGCKAAAGW